MQTARKLCRMAGYDSGENGEVPDFCEKRVENEIYLTADSM
jgi:hypothetical protein